MKPLSKAEEATLLAIWRLKNNAYGVTIREQVHSVSQQRYTYGTLYGLLDQLVRKEHLIRIKGEPTNERGGRSKMFYELTRTGIEALKHAQVEHQSVWEGISDLNLDGKHK